jgi:hypothetical protein
MRFTRPSDTRDFDRRLRLLEAHSGHPPRPPVRMPSRAQIDALVEMSRRSPLMLIEKDEASARYPACPSTVGSAAHYDRAAANRTRGRQRAGGGVFRKRRHQLRNQRRMVRGTAATLGIGQAERGLAGSIPSTCHAPADRVVANAATPLTHAAAERNRWRRPETKFRYFRSPRAPGLRQFTGM